MRVWVGFRARARIGVRVWEGAGVGFGVEARACHAAGFVLSSAVHHLEASASESASKR